MDVILLRRNHDFLKTQRMKGQMSIPKHLRCSLCSPRPKYSYCTWFVWLVLLIHSLSLWFLKARTLRVQSAEVCAHLRWRHIRTPWAFWGMWKEVHLSSSVHPSLSLTANLEMRRKDKNNGEDNSARLPFKRKLEWRYSVTLRTSRRII